MGFKTQRGFQFTGSGDGTKYVSGKRPSFYISEQGNPGPETFTIPTDDLELYLNPSEYTSGTTITDSSGNNRTYDLKNGVTHNSTPARFTFDGTNDYLEAASNYSITTNSATFAVWIKRSGSQENYSGLMFNRSGDTSGLNFYGTSNTINYHWNDSSATWSWNSGVLIPDNSWALAALAVSTTSVTAYLYTTSTTPTQASNTNSHANSTFQNINIGRDPSTTQTSRYFDGDMGHIFFYSAALSQSAITNLYNATKSTYGY